MRLSSPVVYLMDLTPTGINIRIATLAEAFQCLKNANRISFLMTSSSAMSAGSSNSEREK